MCFLNQTNIWSGKKDNKSPEFLTGLYYTSQNFHVDDGYDVESISADFRLLSDITALLLVIMHSEHGWI